MAPNVEELVPLHRVGAKPEAREPIEESAQANHTGALRLSCLGAALTCMIIVWVGFGRWTGDAGNPGSRVSDMLADSAGVPSIALVEKALKCCARGSGGRPGICLPGDPNGICCGTELALLCGAGSLCYTNDQGSPYCCGQQTSGCAHVCLDNFTRDNYVSGGGVCNPVSPQGFNADGTVLYVEAPWDGYRMAYQLDGTQNISFEDPPIRIGAGDFTMTATLIPRNDSTIGITDAANQQRAAVFRRIQVSPTTGVSGYSLVLESDLLFGENAVLVGLVRNDFQERRLQQQEAGSAQFVRFNLSVPILAGVAISLRVIRQGLNVSAFINNVPANEFPQPDGLIIIPVTQPVDVDTDVSVPLEISPRSELQFRPSDMGRVDFAGSIKDLSIISAAVFP